MKTMFRNSVNFVLVIAMVVITPVVAISAWHIAKSANNWWQSAVPPAPTSKQMLEQQAAQGNAAARDLLIADEWNRRAQLALASSRTDRDTQQRQATAADLVNRNVPYLKRVLPGATPARNESGEEFEPLPQQLAVNYCPQVGKRMFPGDTRIWVLVVKPPFSEEDRVWIPVDCLPPNPQDKESLQWQKVSSGKEAERWDILALPGQPTPEKSFNPQGSVKYTFDWNDDGACSISVNGGSWIPLGEGRVPPLYGPVKLRFLLAPGEEKAQTLSVTVTKGRKLASS